MHVVDPQPGKGSNGQNNWGLRDFYGFVHAFLWPSSSAMFNKHACCLISFSNISMHVVRQNKCLENQLFLLLGPNNSCKWMCFLFIWQFPACMIRWPRRHPNRQFEPEFLFDQMIWIKATCMNVKSCPINFECMMLPGSRGAIWKCWFQGQLVLFGIHACLNTQSWLIRMTWMTESITCTMWQDTESERKEQEAMNDFRLI